jgi:hypothetical protein
MRIVPILLLALLSSCASINNTHLSPRQLLESKAQFHESKVIVRGWMRSSFENYALWQSRNAYNNGEWSRDCVSLLIPESMDTSKFDKANVIVEGQFVKRLPRGMVSLGGCNTPRIFVSSVRFAR